ncbi:MAG: class I SAM-dependent methyltransferase [Pirellulales bacterium]
MSNTTASLKTNVAPESGVPALGTSPITGQPETAGRCCRFCGASLRHVFMDLGMSPLCETYLRADQLDSMEPFYPLTAYVCQECLLVQLGEYESPEAIFGEYAYFSSYSDSWLKHADAYCRQMIPRFGLGAASRVVEVASNDGYLLQYFAARGIPVLGIEPAANIARVAMAKGIPTRVEFLGRQTARRMADDGVAADLLVGNNVLAHVPDLNGFVCGLSILLRPGGVLTMEFPHLARLVEGNQFDTIYHEHFCYLSLLVVRKIFAAHGLRIFDVEELSTHGGSLRVYACHESDDRETTVRAEAIASEELRAGYGELETYLHFAERVEETKRKLLEFLIAAKRAGKQIAGYGAPGKGNTLLNYCGIRTDFLAYTVDRNPYKHGKFLPGTHIPIFAPERLAETRPDYILILPWNLKDEIVAQLAYARQWGAKFVVPIPELTVLES